MELPRHVVEGLGLCGNEASFPSEAFRKLLQVAVDSVCSSFAQRSLNETQLPAMKELQAVDPLVTKQAFVSVVSLLIEAAKHDASTQDVGGVLEESKFVDVRTKEFLKVYETRKSQIRATLEQTGSQFSKVVGINWRLDFYVKSNSLAKVKTPVYFITLKVQESDGSIKDIAFTCSFHELQDLLSKLKDGLKQVDRIVSASTA